MIRYLIIYLLLLPVFPLLGQVPYLRLSPLQKIEQRIGMTDITLEYSRPQMKGRKIFGNLVPYNKMWRTGANENSKLTLSHKVKLGETTVESGTYALFTKPMKEKWEIYLYKDFGGLGVPDPIDSSKLIYLTTADSRYTTNVEETLTINFYDLTEASANLGIRWENTEVEIPVFCYTREVMEELISKEIQQNALDYTTAAAYYYERNIELEKAKKLMELSIELREEPSPWAYHSYGIILYKLGEEEKAIEAVNYSLRLSKKSQNEYLITENEKLLSEWWRD